MKQLRYEPLTTPEQWCAQRPCVAVGDTVLSEPLGTLLVFLLALLWGAAGVVFLISGHGQRSRTWLGIALVLGGVGAAQAGISYQAFSYVLKCAGREHCLLTSGFEVGYSVAQALSVSAMLVAVAFASTTGAARRRLVSYSAINAVLYLLVAIVGTRMPSRTLLSFEVLLLFALPGMVLVVLISARRLAGAHRAVDRSLLVATLLLALVHVAYFCYHAAGITQRLWDHGSGFYVSENDVLHVGMMLWLGYVVCVLGRHLRDAGPDGIGS